MAMRSVFFPREASDQLRGAVYQLCRRDPAAADIGRELLAGLSDAAAAGGGKDRDLLGSLQQFRVIHSFDIGTQQRLVDIQTDLTADAGGDFFIVTGQDLYGNAVFMQAADRLFRRFFRRILPGWDRMSVRRMRQEHSIFILM